jgi:hypothetical protein
VVRRLYSTFADGWPGIALLLMRLVVGAVVLWHAGQQLWSHPLSPITIIYAAMALAALLVIPGLWTPMAGVVIAVFALGDIFMTAAPPIGRLLAGTIAGALAMLGPGRWSVDARLFGWRRIDVPAHRK